MTGYGQPHDRQLALEAGFDSFLVKPIDAIVLHDLLATTPIRERAEPKTSDSKLCWH